MTLVYEGMKCAICGKPLDIEGPMVATTHFIADDKDPLWRFSDAAMHQSCFQKWEHREAFIDKYNNTVRGSDWGKRHPHHMKPDGSLDDGLQGI